MKNNNSIEQKALTKYANWLKRKNFSPNTIRTYLKVARKYYQQNLTTNNIQKIFQQNLTKYETNYLFLEKSILISYTKFLKIKVDWERIKPLLPKVQAKYFTTINELELIKLKAVKIEISQRTYERNNLILDFLFYSGVRISELVNIKHRDFQDRALKVIGKGNKIRYVFLPEWLTQIFNPYSRDYLFPSQRANERGNSNQPLPTEYVRQIIQQRTLKAGIKKRITPHSFRRSFATLLHNKGTQLTTIQKLLGHTRLETTIGYIHNDFDYLYQDYSKLWRSPELSSNFLALQSNNNEPNLRNYAN